VPLSESILLLAALLFIGVVVSGLAKKSPIPYTVILVVIGIILSQLSQTWQPLTVIQHFKLTPELVLFVFLPTLIFESGLKLDARQLIKDLAPVLMLAIPALLISTSIIGLGIWYFLSVDLLIALLFGALISATDPVAVIAIFQELGTPQRLTTLVEGESLMNDASAIVLFSILLGLAVAGDSSNFQLSTSIGQFITVFVGGLVIGGIVGLIVCTLINRFEFSTAAIITLSMAAAYASFIVVEHTMHLSGVMAVVACAVIFSLLGAPKLSQSDHHVLTETWEFLVFISNTLLFLLVGISINLSRLLQNIDAIIIAIALVLSARAFGIFSFVPIAVHIFKLPKISLGEQSVMWWGGLKGGLAIAIVLSIPDSLAGKELLLNLTLGVVMFTLLVNAPSIRPLLNKLGINAMDEQEQAELSHGIEVAKEQAQQLLTDFVTANVLSAESFDQVAENTQQSFDTALTKKSKENDLRLIRLNLLQVEHKMLNRLYHQGTMKQYTFLDLQGELNRKKEHLLKSISSGSDSIKERKANLFLRFEDAVVRLLRERDFAISSLVLYQNTRISQHLIKDICSVFLSRSALTELENIVHIDNKDRDDIRRAYLQRIDMLTDRIVDTKNTYPNFYKQFEQRLSQRTALTGALYQVDSQLHNKIIGGKAYAQIKHLIQQQLAKVPPLNQPVQEANKAKLISQAALFDGLPQSVIEQLSQQATSITFLADDTVIEQGSTGDALYIIVHGRFAVYQTQTNGDETQIAELTDGDLFGEIGLLHNAIRTATVRALDEASLLRLTKKTILELATQFNYLYDRLEHAHEDNRD